MTKFTAWCNICDRETERHRSIDGGDCPYHQRVIQDEEGYHLKYDEFDQNGEAY